MIKIISNISNNWMHNFYEMKLPCISKLFLLPDLKHILNLLSGLQPIYWISFPFIHRWCCTISSKMNDKDRDFVIRNGVESVDNGLSTFLFTSESVGEGHPGKYFWKYDCFQKYLFARLCVTVNSRGEKPPYFLLK